MRTVALLAVVLALAACQREERSLRTDPPITADLDHVRPMANGIDGSMPYVDTLLSKPYEGNAYQLSQGKRLYEQFGCVGCHAWGGGAAGPAFIDGWWQYGPQLVSIYVSIRDGRPHGMPAFRDRMTTDEMWQLAGYVKTVGSYAGQTASTSRNDAMQARPAENRAPAADAPARDASRQ